MLAAQHEGVEVAEWLNSLGVTGVLLRYRLGPRYNHPAPLQDAQRAIRTVRARAKEWGIDPERVGILGFSAGGHLASTAATHFDRGSPGAPDRIERESARPDFAILIYPVIAFGTEYGHKGSLRNLLGENPSEAQIKGLSNEKQVSKDTPPCFLAHTNEDSAVPPENSLLFALALRRAGVPLEIHVIEKGPHGLGLGTGSQEHRVPSSASFQVWPGLCATWMKERGYLKQRGSP
jgi:acetyl esterase/lipase